MAADGPKIEYLQKIREQDEKKEGKTSPENESLAPERVRRYLEDNNYTADNFSDKFNLNAALELLRVKRTRGEAVLESQLLKAKGYLDKMVKEKGETPVVGPAGTIGLSDLMEDTNPETFKSTLHKELTSRNELDQEEWLMDAYMKYHTIRSLAYRSLKMKETATKKLEKQKAGPEESLKDQLMGVVGDLKKNFKEMSGKEKLLTVGALIFTAVWLNRTSDNPTIQKWKDGIWSGIKYLGIGIGVGFGVNQVYKLFTGKSGIDALNDAVKDTAGKDEFWTETFDTDAEKADLLRKSTIYMGDVDFKTIARKYRDGAKTQEIRLPTVSNKDMNPKEIYAAADTFFKRYPLDDIEKRYSGSKWVDAVSMQMAEDGRLKLDENVAVRAYEYAREKGVDLWNWLMVGEGLGLMRGLYLKVWGKNEATDEEVKEWTRKYFFQNDTPTEADLDKFIDGKFTHKSAVAYKEALRNGDFDKDHEVKFKQVDGDSMYCISSIKLDNIAGNEKALGSALELAEERAIGFLKKKFPSEADHIYKFVEISGGTRVIANSTFKLFVRMPLKGTPDYEQKNIGVLTPPVVEERRDVEIFGMQNKIDYDDMLKTASADAERLRIRFLLDSTQHTELDKICDWFTRKYRTKNLTIKSVYEQMFTNDDDRKAALLETAVNQKLNTNSGLLNSLEGRLTDIEKDAAKDIKGVGSEYMEAVEQMRISQGYKLRLAILGDTAARASFKGFDPSQKDAMETIIDEYEDACKTYVERRNRGEV